MERGEVKGGGGERGGRERKMLQTRHISECTLLTSVHFRYVNSHLCNKTPEEKHIHTPNDPQFSDSRQPLHPQNIPWLYIYLL